jgi:hypothetical protein
MKRDPNKDCKVCWVSDCDCECDTCKTARARGTNFISLSKIIKNMTHDKKHGL